ncbi:MAG: TlpA disulfide reductase family protein [Chthoniobacterales bacterium]
MKSKHLPLILAAVALGFLAYRSSSTAGNSCPFTSSTAPQGSVQTVANTSGKTEAAPAWRLKDLNGRFVQLADFKGKVVILNFWATWCPPCRAEIPALAALQAKYQSQGLVVIGVSMDEAAPAVVKAFALKAKINYPVVMGTAETAAAYGGVQVIPTTIFIDRQGNVAGTHQGGAGQELFEAAVKPLLGKATANL